MKLPGNMKPTNLHVKVRAGADMMKVRATMDQLIDTKIIKMSR